MYTSKINSWQKLLFVFLRLADCVYSATTIIITLFSHSSFQPTAQDLRQQRTFRTTEVYATVTHAAGLIRRPDHAQRAAN